MARYVGRPEQTTSSSTPATSSASIGRATGQVARRMSGGLQRADINKTNSTVAGNSAEAYKVVTFPKANTDVFVSHKLGFRVDNFDAVSPDAPARFSLGSKAPNVYGMWIRSDTAGVTVRIRMYGQRKG